LRLAHNSTITIAQKLADALDVPVGDLLSELRER